MTEVQYEEFAKRYTEAWCSQDPARVAAFFSPSGLLQINNGAASVGRAAITEAARGFMTAFPDLKVLFNRVEFRGERVLYHWTLVGTNAAPNGTGNRVQISGYEDWRFGQDGLVVESKGHFDAAEYQRQLEGSSGQ
jgi:uncharacterized protein (TIGR02246 family)